MAKAHYLGISGVAQKGKQPHVGVDGVSRKCKSGYIGVDGVARQFLSNNFSDNTWEQIIAACQTNTVPDSWKVADQKPMLINGTEYLIDIIGKNHDIYSDGSGTAPLTFQMHDCYGTSYSMNVNDADYGTVDTNRGGWTSCSMRNRYIPSILALMPSEVQAGIKEVNKLTSAGSMSDTINTTADTLFLLSEIEIFGSVTCSKIGEGSQYEYYSTGNSKVKKKNGSIIGWRERSPYGESSQRFCNVDEYGKSVMDSGGRWPVSLGFCF